jgi:pimeloyl-ACP methyl ester carboxylesterase
MDRPSPGFLFADAGFDVWFGNSRGSFHSLGHVKWNSASDPQYWQFTWQHMADYDIPAMIPFVLQQTKQNKLTYVGHSQGTLQMFAHLADDPSFMKFLNVFIALAPVGTVRHLDISFFGILKEIPLMKALEDRGVYEFLPNPKHNLVFYEVCHSFGAVCDGIIGFFADVQVGSDNLEMIPTIMAHEPGGTSTLNMQHWQQMTNYWSSKVQKFDYGSEANLANYGQTLPPHYDFSKIPGPIALFTGSDDKLADPKDVSWLESILPSQSISFKANFPSFGHATFIWGNLTSMQYMQQVINLAKNYKS